jgi:outer membrane protein assembly factor BamB
MVGRRHGSGPKGTPVVDGGRVYTVGIAGWLQCLDVHDGRVVWSVNFPAEFGARVPLPSGRAYVDGTDSVIVPIGNGLGAPVPLFGYTGSPVLEGNLLITSVGGQRAGTIMAFDKQTGKVVWKSLAENVSYSSPIVATLAGARQVVVMTGPRIVGLDLADGHLLWSHSFQVQYDESIATPAVGEDCVVVTGDGHPLECVKITRQGSKFTAQLAWENFEMSSYLSSMLVHGGHIYGMNGGGEFGCVRLTDGKTLWTGGHYGSYCTPVLAGSRLLGLTEHGELAVVEAQPQGFQEVGKNVLSDSATWTSPALVGNRVFVRSAESVRCFQLGR